jgi:hypothetical protein
VCPTWHPSYCLRSEEKAEKEKEPAYMEVLNDHFNRHIAQAVSHQERPWDKTPMYRVIPIINTDEAADRIREITKSAGLVAWDYETTCLKPEYDGAEIVSCSVSDGDTTIAYPWQGKAITATRDMLRSKRVKKVGNNIKFEERWTWAEFGHGVSGWVWDDMLNAHLIDNRRDITSIKFQAFVLFGAPPWDEHVAPYLEGDGKYGHINRIREVGLPQLLTYNGMDSLMEYDVALEQAHQLGVKL